MAALDWIIAAVLLASLLLGVLRGLVFELLSLLGWVAAFILAQWFAGDVAAWLPMQTANETLRYAAGFAVVFVGAIFGFGLLAALTRRLVEAAGLRPADRALGALFGMVRGMLILLVITAVLQMMQLTGSVWWRESQGAAWLVGTLEVMRPVLPGRFGKFLME